MFLQWTPQMNDIDSIGFLIKKHYILLFCQKFLWLSFWNNFKKSPEISVKRKRSACDKYSRRQDQHKSIARSIHEKKLLNLIKSQYIQNFLNQVI